ncbi:DedA family protein [bacterium]|nr:DedA family protein [bacterium]
MDWIELGFIGLFLATFLAATVLPFSSEFVLISLISAGYDPFLCVITATIGNTLGGMSSYILGRIGDYNRISKWLRMDQSGINKWKPKIDRYGHWTALLCWLPIIGDPIAVALGVFRTKWIPVLILMTVGKGIRYFLVVFIQLKAVI